MSSADENVQGRTHTETHSAIMRGRGDFDGSDLLATGVQMASIVGVATTLGARGRQLIEAYIRQGGDPNKGDQLGWTGLMAAAENGRLDFVDLFLRLGADVNALTNDGHTVLAVAATNGHAEVAEHLLRQGADVELNGGFALLAAIACSDSCLPSQFVQLIHLLLKEGANVHPRNVPRKAIENLSNTLLSANTRFAWMRMVRAKLNIDRSASCSCESPLAWAASVGNGHIIKTLLERGALVDQPMWGGTTPLMWAALAGRADSVQLLLELGADPTIRDENGASALELAVEDAVLPLLALEQYRSLGTALPNGDQQTKRRL